MTDIRTPDDEIDKPGYFYPPFREGWNYQGATYGGHTDHSVDFNRRTPTGGWLEDDGHPVYAAADGHVSEVDEGDGLVMLNHWGGLYRTEYRHMKDIPVKVGQKVERGDRIGSIGNVAGDGRSFGSHLHHVHYRRDSTEEPWRRVKMRLEGKPIATSVPDSDSRPKAWSPPPPVNVVGPPPKATWASAYQDALDELVRVAATLATRTQQMADQKASYQSQVDQLEADLASAQSRIEILESATQPDLTEVRKAARQSFKDEVAALPV